MRTGNRTELISVIVATYNREDALDAVLRSLAGQADRGFEVVVADDGSGLATARVIESWRPRIGVPLTHVWHEDTGFRLAEIRNRAILRSSGQICVFLDGDCIARPSFIAVHRRLAEPGWFVAGNRVLLDATLTERILREQLRPELWRPWPWIDARRSGHINRLLPLLTLPLGPLRKLRPRSWTSLRGTNLAIWRCDLDRVDGFDASYRGWGLEDSDLVIRLIRSGVRCKFGRFASGVLHLWHPESDRSQMSANERKLAEVMKEDRVRALSGLSAIAVVEADRAGGAIARGNGYGRRSRGPI